MGCPQSRLADDRPVTTRDVDVRRSEPGLADAPDAEDIIVETDGVQLVVDPVSLELVAGCTVNFVESLGGAAFQ